MATEARLAFPYQITVDGEGNLYIADRDAHRVRKVDAQGRISTFAGSGTAGFAGDGGSAAAAQLSAPRGVAVDADGNVYISDSGNNRIRRVAPDGTISTFAGSGNAGFSGDRGKATEASLDLPLALAVDRRGNVYIADYDNNRIRQVTRDGLIRTVAGNGGTGATGDGGSAVDASVGGPRGIAVDAVGNLYIAQAEANRIRRVSADARITTVAGGGTPGFTGDGGTATDALLNSPLAVAADANGRLLIADSANNRIRRVTPDGTIGTFAGGPGANSLPASQVSVIYPRGGVRDRAGNFYVADNGHCRILKIDPSGIVTVIAGNGAPGGYHGEGLNATAASLGTPEDGCHIDGLAVDAADNIYIPDLFQHRVLKLDAAGNLTTVAGNGLTGFSGDGGRAIQASFSPEIWNVALDGQGNLYIADGANHRVRRVDTNGMITTVAGSGSESYSGDGGKALDAGIPLPDGLFIDAIGNLYIADPMDQRIHRVAPNGTLTTVVGTGEAGFSGDGSRATQARFAGAENVAVDAAGNLYFTDVMNHRIRKVDPNGIITTFAGTGNEGFNGDDKPLLETNISEPHDLYIDAAGNLILAENSVSSNRIRIILLAP
jgi:sugar lactone lactonase YvrE